MMKLYWFFKNMLLTSEHLTGKLGYWIDNLFPSSHYAAPYCYICRKGWFQILDGIREDFILQLKKEEVK